MKLFLFIEIIYFFLYKKKIYSCFSLSKTFMMCSSSSSLLNGMLIFPLPLAEQVNCTLVLRNLESFSLSMVNSSGIYVLAVMVFLPLSTSSPLFSRCTISSTFLTE